MINQMLGGGSVVGSSDVSMGTVGRMGRMGRDAAHTMLRQHRYDVDNRHVSAANNYHATAIVNRSVSPHSLTERIRVEICHLQPCTASSSGSASTSGDQSPSTSSLHVDPITGLRHLRRPSTDDGSLTGSSGSLWESGNHGNNSSGNHGNYGSPLMDSMLLKQFSDAASIADRSCTPTPPICESPPIFREQDDDDDADGDTVPPELIPIRPVNRELELIRKSRERGRRGSAPVLLISRSQVHSLSSLPETKDDIDLNKPKSPRSEDDDIQRKLTIAPRPPVNPACSEFKRPAIRRGSLPAEMLCERLEMRAKKILPPQRPLSDPRKSHVSEQLHHALHGLYMRQSSNDNLHSETKPKLTIDTPAKIDAGMDPSAIKRRMSVDDGLATNTLSNIGVLNPDKDPLTSAPTLTGWMSGYGRSRNDNKDSKITEFTSVKKKVKKRDLNAWAPNSM